MKSKFKNIYQFKITLRGIRPPLWRRIQVPENYSFWDLHVAIQDSMGWSDYHLHQFDIINPATGMKEEIGIPGDHSDMDFEIIPGWKKKIKKYFSLNNSKSYYLYDFGDNWEHEMQLEKILSCGDSALKYPLCTGGKRACPPEDCGGIQGYENFLEIIANPNHDEYDEMLEWAGGEFEPEHFDIKEIKFDDPQKRFKIAFEENT